MVALCTLHWLLSTALFVKACRAENAGATPRIRAAVQPVLDDMAQKYNMSFSFGYVDARGRVGLAAGIDSIWKNTPLRPDSLVPLGSVTKPWTAVAVMQAVERGAISLEDPVAPLVDPVLKRLFNKTMMQLWGRNETSRSFVPLVRIKDLLGMTSGFHDYNDFFLEHFTLEHRSDDPGPIVYLASAALQGFLCKPGTCAMYSGSNYVVLGLVLVQLAGLWSWQDLNQMGVISPKLWSTGRYSHTSFPKLGRCLQYPGVAHQYVNYNSPDPGKTQTFIDLAYASCLNGWTMGNIASSAEDLATFFYDLFTLSPKDGGYLNATTLELMQQYKRLDDDWCEGPTGYGSCTYGMGLLADQVGQDVWALRNDTKDPATAMRDIRVIGHPGEDWGSGCSPCGYNKRYGFGICIAYTSVIGMNCSADFSYNYNAVQEATCLAYNAVLSQVGGPSLNCTVPPLNASATASTCEWTKDDVWRPHLGPGPSLHHQSRGQVSHPSQPQPRESERRKREMFV